MHLGLDPGQNTECKRHKSKGKKSLYISPDGRYAICAKGCTRIDVIDFFYFHSPEEFEDRKHAASVLADLHKTGKLVTGSQVTAPPTPRRIAERSAYYGKMSEYRSKLNKIQWDKKLSLEILERYKSEVEATVEGERSCELFQTDFLRWRFPENGLLCLGELQQWPRYAKSLDWPQRKDLVFMRFICPNYLKGKPRNG